MRKRKSPAFTLLESLIAMFMLSLVLTFTALLFHKSYQVTRKLDEKERTRQAARMGLDRITSELREAVEITDSGGGVLEFLKIDPNATIVEPEAEPEDPEDDFEPAPYNAMIAYPLSSRLRVRYRTENEKLIREVRRASGGGWGGQGVVVGGNSFLCEQNPDNRGEVDVTVSVLDNRIVKTISSRVLCPCIREEFGV